MNKHIFFKMLIGVLLTLIACKSQQIKPYNCGPVFTQKQVKKTFQPLIEIMDLSSGDVYADVGASSGWFDVMISMLVDSVSFYMQDIDTACLNQNELDKIIFYYSNIKGTPLSDSHNYKIVIGTDKATNLPDNTFDKIYSNGTFHVFEYKERMIADIYQKIKKGGYLFIRDGFSTDDQIKPCDDKTCKKNYTKESEFLKIMKNSGFILEKKYPDFSGFPLYKFRKG